MIAMSPGSRKSAPGIGWVYRQTLAQLRPVTFLFTFLFLVAMPAALLMIGKDHYLALISRYHILETSLARHHLNQVLWPLHSVLAILVLAASALLAGVAFHTTFLPRAVDREASLPLDKDRQFLGRALALISSFVFIFLINAAATGLVFAGWGRLSHFVGYLPTYLELLSGSLELVAFYLLILALSGTLFDAVLTGLSLQLVWPVALFQVMAAASRLDSLKAEILWFLAPAARLFAPLLDQRTTVQSLIMLLFFMTTAWWVSRRRPAEWAGVRNGQLAWYPVLQPLFALFGGSLLGRFVHVLFVDDRKVLKSPVFFIGLLAGALLGQFFSSVISGKALRSLKIRQELLSALAGILLFFLMTGLAHLLAAPVAEPW